MTTSQTTKEPQSPSPTHCRMCSCPLDESNGILRCSNSDCPAYWKALPIHDVDIEQKRQEQLNQGGKRFETGAVRSNDKDGVMYQLISPIGLRRMAETMKEGFDKYGAYNWEDGMPIGDILNHAIAHIYEYLSSPSPESRNEDDLAHAAWNLFAAMHMEETHPNLDHGLRK